MQLVGAEMLFIAPMPLVSLSLPVSRGSFTILAWVSIDQEELRASSSFPLVRKPSSNPEVSCWGWFFPSTFSYGAHDYHSIGMADSTRWEESVSVGGSDLGDGSLTHEAIVVDGVGSSITFFRDGAARGPAIPLQRPITDCVGTIQIGGQGTILSSVKFYPRVLMPSEVSEIFQNGQPLVETATGSLLNSVQEKELTLIRGAIQNVTESAASLQEEQFEDEQILLEVSENRIREEEQRQREQILYSYTQDLAPCAALPWWEDESKLPLQALHAWRECGQPRTNRTGEGSFAGLLEQSRMQPSLKNCPDDNRNYFFCSHSSTYPLHDQCSSKEQKQQSCGDLPTVLGEAPTCPNGEKACCCLPNGRQCAVEDTASDDWGRSRRQKAALLIVDVQECFLENGSLPVPDSSAIVAVINSLKDRGRCLFDLVVKTADYHPRNHISFASTHGLAPFYNHPAGISLRCTQSRSHKMSESACCPKRDTGGTLHCPMRSGGCPNESVVTSTNNPSCTACAQEAADSGECFTLQQSMWPDHCLQDGDWIFPQSLEKFDEGPNAVPEVIVKLGRFPFIDAYSAFWDNSKESKTELDDVLRAADIGKLYVAGLATDYTVKYTALAAADLGYEVVLLTDAAKGLDAATTAAALSEMQARGIVISSSNETVCHSTAKSHLDMWCCRNETRMKYYSVLESPVYSAAQSRPWQVFFQLPPLPTIRVCVRLCSSCSFSHGNRQAFFLFFVGREKASNGERGGWGRGEKERREIKRE